MRFSQWPLSPEVRGAVPHCVRAAVKREMQRMGLCSTYSCCRSLTLSYGVRFIPLKALPSQPPDLPPPYLLEATIGPFVPAATAHPGLTSQAVTVYCM